MLKILTHYFQFDGGIELRLRLSEGGVVGKALIDVPVMLGLGSELDDACHLFTTAMSSSDDLSAVGISSFSIL